MNPSPSRREFLRLVPTASTSSLLGASPRARDGGRGAAGFDPARHGFGFRNWSSAVPTFPQHRHQSVDESEVRRIIDARWIRPVRRTLGVDLGHAPEELIRSIARQVYVSASQESASNGHCYGMVFAAQRYFEEPAAVPLGRETASEFEHPEVPLDRTGREKSPLATDIDVYQNLQLLDPNAWIGRRGLFFPEWIDLDGSIRNVERVLDAFGTAGVTLLNSRTKASHQVLIYDARRVGNRTRFAIYDPNYSAAHYRRSGPRYLELVHGEDGARMVPYETYDTFVFNRRDRLIAATGGGSGPVDPLPAFDPTPGTVADRLLRPVVFSVVGEGVDVVVLDPDGRRVRREHATYADPDRTAVEALRYRYGGRPGTYRVAVTGTADADYTVRVDAATPDGPLLCRAAAGRITAGDTHYYRAQVPERTADEGRLDRVEPDGNPDWPALVAGGAAAVGLGAVAGRLSSCRRGSAEATDDQ